MDVKKLTLCGVMAAVTCVLAPISVSFTTTVPLSLATFAVMLSGLLLGGGYGALSQTVYLLLGVIGLPVCAGWTPALPRLLGPTGGYLVGYIPMALICGAVYGAFGRRAEGVKKYAVMTGAMALSTAVLYAFGTAWFCILNGVGVGYALTICVLPFLVGDAVKIAAAALIVPRLEKLIGANAQ